MASKHALLRSVPGLQRSYNRQLTALRTLQKAWIPFQSWPMDLERLYNVLSVQERELREIAAAIEDAKVKAGFGRTPGLGLAPLAIIAVYFGVSIVIAATGLVAAEMYSRIDAANARSRQADVYIKALEAEFARQQKGGGPIVLPPPVNLPAPAGPLVEFPSLWPLAILGAGVGALVLFSRRRW